MIVILYDSGHQLICTEIDTAVREAYKDQLDIKCVQADEANAWPGKPSWDDLIIVLFGSDKFEGDQREFLQREAQTRPVLPVALSDKYKAPPPPLDGIKALTWNDRLHDPKGKLLRRVGSLVGLKLRSRDQTVFVSYRARDGTMLATQIETLLKEHGYRVWRDASRDEFDDEAKILAGEDVQQVIDKNLLSANVLVLLDTPQAASSRWIKIEVDRANGQLIPVFPLLFLGPGERRRTSRFRSLATLQRGCDFLVANDVSSFKLSVEQRDRVLTELEQYLCDIFQRKLRVPFLVEKEFTSRGYDWSNRDRFIYEALRRSKGELRTRVFSHCSYFEGVYDPALLAFVQHLENTRPRSNYALYVYDGLGIPETQIEEIRRGARLEDATDIIILHHEEIKHLLTSNFQRIRA
jgi:TIR domain-containing protein